MMLWLHHTLMTQINELICDVDDATAIHASQMEFQVISANLSSNSLHGKIIII